MLKNRIEKNWKKLKSWSEQHKIEAFRLYDRDIPEFQLIVDKYKDYFLVYDKSDPYLDAGKDLVTPAKKAIAELFKVSAEQIVIKMRSRQAGLQQYEKLDETNRFFTVHEGPAKFRVNLWDYLDTGLFLDHRPMRAQIFKQSSGKSLLNLFCYTGSVSVCGALSGAITTSVDMSTTYLDWAKENFSENSLPLEKHQFIRADVLSWLYEDSAQQKYDLIFLDPPTFSNSKKMDGTFEVERDQDSLIDSVMQKLNSDGTLYFSNNKRKFKISERILNVYAVKNITPQTIPRDFHDQKIHQCYEIRHK